jgi:uncharacterized membrane protein
MSIDKFISRVWRVLSMIAFGISLLFVYRGLPDPTAVHFGETGRGDGFLPKEEIFYLTAAIVTILNVLGLLLIRSIEKIPRSYFGNFLNAFAEKGDLIIQQTCVHWIHFLLALINTYLILAFRVLLLLNDERTNQADYSYLPKVGIALFLIWMIYLPARLWSYPNSTDEEL